MLVSGHCAHYGRKPPVQPVIRWRVRWWPAWECEMRGAEGNGGPKERGPELVVVGHLGTSIVHARAVSRTAAGGSGYAGAARARAPLRGPTRPVGPGGEGLDLPPPP